VGRGAALAGPARWPHPVRVAINTGELPEDSTDFAPHIARLQEADDEDWMKDWYARLGFDPIGRTWRFTRLSDPS
jgi:hypothetical protein